MIHLPNLQNSGEDSPVWSASFFLWSYRFYTDRIEIDRNFLLSRRTVISMDKIEMLAFETDPLLSHFGRCNIVLTFAGNIFTLIGVPVEIADHLMEQLSDSLGASGEAVRIPAADLLRRSALGSKLLWYIPLNLLLWAAVFLMDSSVIDAAWAQTVSDAAFRYLLVGGALVLSLGLPTVLLWIWAFTGGFLLQYCKYYRYTATRRGDLLYFEYGLLIHRRIYLDARRIAIVEFQQTPLMQAFGCGQLRVRAVGHNPIFFKAKLILPFVRASAVGDTLRILFPGIGLPAEQGCKRSLFYNFFTLKQFLPLACLCCVPIWGPTWLAVALLAEAFVIWSVCLEYRNARLTLYRSANPNTSLLALSKGGFIRTAAIIDRERVEMLAISGSRRKLRRGFANVRVRVFGKSGTYAIVRNICLAQIEEQN